MTLVCELVTDGQGVITSASPEAAALFAIDDRWLVRKPLATFVSEQDRRRFRLFVAGFGSGRSTSSSAAFVLENRNGKAIPAELAATRHDGALAWSVKADAEPIAPTPTFPAVARQDRLYERLLTRLPTGVVVVDRQLRVVYANPAARRLIDVTAMRTGLPLPEPWPGFQLRTLAKGLFTSAPDLASHLVDVGDRVVCVEGIAAAAAAAAPTAALTVEDVTERERTRRAERQFVENAAHELRTPLAAIVSVVDVLESGAKDDPASRDRFLAHIRAHSERLVRLANSLLMLARIQTGREQPRLDLVPIEPLLQEIASTLEPRGDVAIEVRAPKDVAALADVDLLHQVLENVALNAARHTHRGRIRLEGRDLGQKIEIEISDTGTGMSRLDAAHAFDRFYRSSRREEGGFGLGLAIAAEAMRALDGTVELKSTSGAGTHVRIRLPSARIVNA